MKRDAKAARETALQKKVMEAISKRERGSLLEDSDWDALTLAALCYLHERGHLIDLEALPPLPDKYKRALDDLGPSIVDRVRARMESEERKDRGRS